MLIIPTEKRFDASRAPWVLFALVLVNILVYVIYQGQDDDKQYAAVERYLQYDYLSLEYPIFQRYLTEQEELRLLNQLDRLHQYNEHEIVASYILYYRDFVPYLEREAYREFDADTLRQWRVQRSEIQQQFMLISSMAYGLIATEFRIVTLFSYQFLHGSIDHLLGNLIFLIIFGFAVEAAIGHLRFLAFYLLSGIAAGLAQVVTHLDSSIPLIGASGSISGVMAMYLAVFKMRKIEFFYWIFFFVGYLRLPALLILPFYFGKEIYSYISNIDSNVAFMAHAGGIVGGAVLMAIATWLSPSIINEQYVTENQQYTARQQALAKIAQLIEKFKFNQALAATNELIAQEKLDFELALMRFNLAKVNPDKQFPLYLRDLFLQPTVALSELQHIAQAWLQYGRFAKLNTEQKLALAIRLSHLSQTGVAQKIHDELYQTATKPKGLNLLTKKLMDRFIERQEGERLSEYKQRYQVIAQELGNGHL